MRQESSDLSPGTLVWKLLGGLIVPLQRETTREGVRVCSRVLVVPGGVTVNRNDLTLKPHCAKHFLLNEAGTTSD